MQHQTPQYLQQHPPRLSALTCLLSSPICTSSTADSTTLPRMSPTTIRPDTAVSRKLEAQASLRAESTFTRHDTSHDHTTPESCCTQPQARLSCWLRPPSAFAGAAGDVPGGLCCSPAAAVVLAAVPLAASEKGLWFSGLLTAAEPVEPLPRLAPPAPAAPVVAALLPLSDCAASAAVVVVLPVGVLLLPAAVWSRLAGSSRKGRPPATARVAPSSSSGMNSDCSAARKPCRFSRGRQRAVTVKAEDVATTLAAPKSDNRVAACPPCCTTAWSLEAALTGEARLQHSVKQVREAQGPALLPPWQVSSQPDPAEHCYHALVHAGQIISAGTTTMHTQPFLLQTKAFTVLPRQLIVLGSPKLTRTNR